MVVVVEEEDEEERRKRKILNGLFVVVAEPSARNPLRFALQPVDFGH